MKDLTGTNAVVTGAASGIGLGICRALAREGVNIALADIEPGPLDEAVAEIARLGVEAFGVPLDVSDEAAVGHAAEQVSARFERLHLLVNNAGVAFAGSPLLGVPQQQLDWIFGVNVFGMLHCLRAFVPLLRRHGDRGHILNTASIGGLQVNPQLRNGPYAMTKYAVVAMSETLALDLAGSGIGVSVFCPALVATQLMRSGERRPERFGGPHRPATPDATAASRVMPTRAMSADEAGARAVAAIRNDELFVFTHPETRAWIEARHRRLMQGFDQVDAWGAGATGASSDNNDP